MHRLSDGAWPKPRRNVHAITTDFGEVLLWSFWFFVWIAALMVWFRCLFDLFRDSSLSGWAKAGWVILLVFVPWLGALIYLIARGRSMTERRRAEVAQRQAEQETYIQKVAGTSQGPAEQIANAIRLLSGEALTTRDRLPPTPPLQHEHHDDRTGQRTDDPAETEGQTITGDQTGEKTTEERPENSCDEGTPPLNTPGRSADNELRSGTDEHPEQDDSEQEHGQRLSTETESAALWHPMRRPAGVDLVI